MERKLIDITLPRMEDKPKIWNTQRDKGPKLLINDLLKLIIIHYLIVHCNWI